MLASDVFAGRALWVVERGDCREVLRGLPEGSVHCVVTSPPYWGLRDYKLPPLVWGGVVGHEHEWTELPTIRRGGANGGGEMTVGRDQSAREAVRSRSTGDACLCGAWRGSLGLEPTPGLYVEHVVEVFREVHRVLREDGSLWLNLGDSYCTVPHGPKGANAVDPKWPAARRRGPGGQPNRQAVVGLKHKDLVGMPWRVAFALQEDGWYLRRDIIWAKPNPMPESIRDRPTSAHEYLFLLTKAPRYYYDGDAIREPYAASTLSEVEQGYDGKARKEFEGAGVQNASAVKKRIVQGILKQDGHGRRHAGFNERWAAAVSEAPLVRGANRRSVWWISPEPFAEAHFATFPVALVEPCVKAGSSERGCCGSCGVPWRRVVEKGEPVLEWQRDSGADARGEYDGESTKGHAEAGVQDASEVKRRVLAGMVEKRTVDWKPTCACKDVGVVSCVVLDPFAGSGTTGLAALQLGRRFIGVELSPEYVALAEKRLGAWRGQQRLGVL